MNTIQSNDKYNELQYCQFSHILSPPLNFDSWISSWHMLVDTKGHYFFLILDKIFLLSEF